MDRKTFEIVNLETIPSDASELPARYILTMKDKNGNVTYKACFVICEHRDSMKILIVHSSQNIQPSFIWLLLFRDAKQNFKIWIEDVC